jgi:hypothetical protein
MAKKLFNLYDTLKRSYIELHQVNREAAREYEALRKVHYRRSEMKKPFRLAPMEEVDAKHPARKATQPFMKRNLTVASEARRELGQFHRRSTDRNWWVSFDKDMGGVGFGDRDITLHKKNTSEMSHWPRGFTLHQIEEETRKGIDARIERGKAIEIKPKEEEKVGPDWSDGSDVATPKGPKDGVAKTLQDSVNTASESYDPNKSEKS